MLSRGISDQEQARLRLPSALCLYARPWFFSVHLGGVSKVCNHRCYVVQQCSLCRQKLPTLLVVGDQNAGRDSTWPKLRQTTATSLPLVWWWWWCLPLLLPAHTSVRVVYWHRAIAPVSSMPASHPTLSSRGRTRHRCQSPYRYACMQPTRRWAHGSGLAGCPPGGLEMKMCRACSSMCCSAQSNSKENATGKGLQQSSRPPHHPRGAGRSFRNLRKGAALA